MKKEKIKFLENNQNVFGSQDYVECINKLGQ